MGLRTTRRCSNNPHFYVDVVSPNTTVFVSLLQAELDRDNLPAIGFKLLSKGGKRVRSVYSGEQVLGGAYSHASEVRHCVFHERAQQRVCCV